MLSPWRPFLSTRIAKPDGIIRSGELGPAAQIFSTPARIDPYWSVQRTGFLLKDTFQCSTVLLEAAAIGIATDGFGAAFFGLDLVKCGTNLLLDVAAKGEELDRAHEATKLIGFQAEFGALMGGLLFGKNGVSVGADIGDLIGKIGSLSEPLGHLKELKSGAQLVVAEKMAELYTSSKDTITGAGKTSKEHDASSGGRGSLGGKSKEIFRGGDPQNERGVRGSGKVVA